MPVGASLGTQPSLRLTTDCRSALSVIVLTLRRPKKHFHLPIPRYTLVLRQPAIPGGTGKGAGDRFCPPALNR